MSVPRIFDVCFILTTLALLPAPRISPADTVEIPVALDYRLLDQTLAVQMFTGPNDSAEVFSDRIGCNRLVLSEPQVHGTAGGRIVLRSTMRANTGTPMGGKCRFAKRWEGIVEAEQTARLEPGSAVVTFHVEESRLLSDADGEDALPRFMSRWIRDYVNPRLASVRIDLQPMLTGLEDFLDTALSGTNGLSGPRLAGIQPTEAALVANLRIETTPPAQAWAPEKQAPLTAAELARWDQAWQAWDAFATWLIKTLALSAGPELTNALAETLIEARYDLRDALAVDEPGTDPVRALFLRTWQRLAPLVSEVQLGLPGSQALPFASFIGAADALQALNRLAPHLGIQLDRDALRAMARMLVPGVTDYQLRYDTTVDPELRRLLGLAPVLDSGGEGSALLSWFIPNAHAAKIDPELIKSLNRWTPRHRDVDDYLRAMDRLLDAIATTERKQDKIPSRYGDLYETLLRATAWQESCWRQFVERGGELETIRSSAGSVGLMQINVHVWRGLYDIDQLLTRVEYNARAGNEILTHYLVDYAIRKGEHQKSGGETNLARATYAVYNGGPRHLTRYRDPQTAAGLKNIDQAFWSKYQAIETEGSMAVRRCLTGQT